MSEWRHIEPYDFQYRFKVDRELAGKTLIDFYLKRFSFKPREYWVDLIVRGESSVNDLPATPATVLNYDDIVRTWRRDVAEPPVNARIEILHDDGALFVLNKKAPVPVHPSGRFFKNSLTTILRERYPERKFHTIHRLDLWTTGVLVLATDDKLALHLHRQVKQGRVGKEYGVLAVGDFGGEPFVVDAAIGRANKVRRGVGEAVENPKSSVTQFVPLLKQGIAHDAKLPLWFLKAKPITGRTNQIRVHIESRGGYVLNDPLYSPFPDPEEKIPFLGLHCRRMEFILPSGEIFRATAPWPDGFTASFPDDELARAFG